MVASITSGSVGLTPGCGLGVSGPRSEPTASAETSRATPMTGFLLTTEPLRGYLSLSMSSRVRNFRTDYRRTAMAKCEGLTQ